MITAMADQILETLNAVFGFRVLRPGQPEVIERLLRGRSSLAIFPTGSGKSLCYQLPSMLMDGLTIVISPLIALMKDQLDFLQARGIRAARIDSTLSQSEYRQVMNDLKGNQLRMLYVAPERLANERFLAALRGKKIAMLAVDEAHCISEWGHNFRPDYLRLAKLAKELKVERILGLTATATPAVAKDIARIFNIAEEDIVRTGFHRPNLELHISPCSREEKMDRLVTRLRERPPGAGIVYVTLQKTAEEVASKLSKEGIDARAYHAGMESETRTNVQDWFMCESSPIVVATIAFGMGIDKSDLRYVYHYNLPKTLENYAQEIGRSGRDNKPAWCEMLASPEDRIVLENFVYGDTPDDNAVTNAVEDIFSRGKVFDLSLIELSSQHDIRPLVLGTLMTYLELEHILEPTGPFYTQYEILAKRSSKEILGDFDADRAKFLGNLFRQMKMKTKLLHLDIAAAATALAEPRERIIKALGYLEERGDLELKVRGLRQGFRLLQSKPDIAALSTQLVARVIERERREIERLQEMLLFVTQAGCSTRFLLEYFGDSTGLANLSSEEECGHCGWCLGTRPKRLPRNDFTQFGQVAKVIVSKWKASGVPSLASSRQLARFLCGISSPGTRGKMSKEADFGTFAEVPFKTVMKWCEESAVSS